MPKCDFSGYATRNNLECADGRIIRKNAFIGDNGQKVPLVWNHGRTSPDDVLGHAILENRDDGVYAYCTFNNTQGADTAKKLLQHGDIDSLSIYANKLKHVGKEVVHGKIRELSLVLAGANPGATIDFIMAHGDEGDDACVASYDERIMIHCADDIEVPEDVALEGDELEHSEKENSVKMEEENKTIGEIFDSFTEEEKTAVYAMIGQALEDAGVSEDDDEEEDPDMKHNVFESDIEGGYDDSLIHSAMDAIITDGKKYGSLKESFLAHADEYGIENIEYLFPEAKALTNTPEFIKREMGWVQTVMNGVHHTPFSRIKSVFADITEDEARAKGYLKGKLKKEEVFSLLKRTTTPTTIYKKQKIDRDDVIDITDMDVVVFLKGEMRMMLDEEIARAILIGDGRLASSDDKIPETNIRPVWTDEELYTVPVRFSVSSTDTDEAKAKMAIKKIIKARKEYKGSGNPTLFTTEDFVTDCLLIEDTTGRRIYNSVNDLAITLRVKEIITVEVMEGASRTVDSVDYDLLGIMVNLSDYNVGADKGGAINMFDDFDIDYNQQKYLIETRCSGALIKPKSALAIEVTTATAQG